MPLAAAADTGTFIAHLMPNHHYPHATGAAKFDHNPNHDTLTLGVAVQNAVPLSTAGLVVDGNVVGTFPLDHTGSGSLTLSSLHGDDIPDLGEGDRVKIVDADTGKTLLKGKLSPVNP
jgi:hypothetical protein